MYGIFTYIYHKKNQPNVGKYTSPMDPMGTKQTVISSPFISPILWKMPFRIQFQISTWLGFFFGVDARNSGGENIAMTKLGGTLCWDNVAF